MRGILILLCSLTLSGCDSNWGGSSTTMQLDDSALEGCYQSDGVPDLLFEPQQVKSGGTVVYDQYDYVRAGRTNSPVVIVRPRVALVKSASGRYVFEPTMSHGGDNFSYEVSGSGGALVISIVSSPDAIRHDYKKVPCQNQKR